MRATTLTAFAGTLNRMLDRIAILMDSLRQVSSDVAHDLRTPLSRLYQRLEGARLHARSLADFEGPGRQIDKDSKSIESWGHLGPEPGNFNDPHDIAIGGSENHVFVADRQNRRAQVFDQDGNFNAAWSQFGEVNSVFVSKDDRIYAGTSFADSDVTKGEVRGILIGNAKTGPSRRSFPTRSTSTASCAGPPRRASPPMPTATFMRPTSAATICENMS